MIARITPDSDVVGAVASGLCVLHCIATPFLFIAQTCSVTGCCESSPAWWSAIDYVFVVVTFFAVYHSSKNTGKAWLKYALFGSWVVLSLLVVNEKFDFLHLSEWWKYLAAFLLIALHIYNLKFCNCKEDACCIEPD